MILEQLKNTITCNASQEKAELLNSRFGGIANKDDTAIIAWKFLHWLLTEELKVEGEGEVLDNVRKAIKQCVDVLVPLTKGEKADASLSAGAACYASCVACATARVSTYIDSIDASYAASFAADAAFAAFTTNTSCIIYTINFDGIFLKAARAGASYDRMADKLIELIEEVKA